MSNYTKSTNFTAKDSLPTGDTNKVVRGSEFDTEFNALSTAVSTKADLAGPTFTGTATFANVTATGTVNFNGATISNLGTITTANLDGGTVDGAVIGGASAAAGSFTTLSASSTFSLGGVAVTSTAAELNILDGVTSTASELNILDGKSFVDEDDLSSNSATGIPSQQSVKAYVDSQTGLGGATLAGLADTTVTSPADAALLFYDTGTSKWIDNVVSGDVTIADTGVAAIGSGVIVNADVNASAAIDVSKTALVAGTGISLSTNTLNVDAAQTQITSVGTLGSLDVDNIQLDANAVKSTNTNGNIQLFPNGTGFTELYGNTNAGAIRFNCESNSHGVTIKGPPHSATATYELELPNADGTNGQFLKTNGSGKLSFGTVDVSTKVDENHTGDVNITGELLVDSYNETFKQPTQVNANMTFDWSVFATTGNTKTASGTDRRGIIQWKPDGTRFFLNDHGGSDAIHQFDLSTANNFATASLTSTTTSASAGFSKTNVDIVFSSDGQYLFGVERGSNSALYRLTLNTAWTPSAGSSAETTVRTLTSGGYTYCVDISADGTKFYVLDDNDTINEYTFGTAYDPSTLGTTATSTFVPTGGSGNVFQTFKFTNGGSNLIVLRNDGATLYEYALGTAYTLSTINSTPTQTISASTGSNSRAIGVHPNNTHVYVAGNSSTNIVEYGVTSVGKNIPIDCENANVFSATLSANSTVTFSNPPAAGTATDSTAYAMSLKIVQDAGASGYTVTWPTSVKWPSGTAPTLTDTANAVDQFVFYTYTGGTTWYGFTAGQALG